MIKKTHNDLEPILFDTRDELIWVLEYVGYNATQIARMFNIHVSNVSRAIARRERGWRPAHATILKSINKK